MKKLTLSLVLTCLAAVGCEQGGNTPAPEPPATTSEHDHAHPTEGPHHGDLVELGNEEYHAEVVHGDDKGLLVYILDSAAKSSVAISAMTITINVSHDGQPEQFQLAAKPQSGDPEGKASCFQSSDADLVSHLDEEGAEATLVLMIEEQSFRGKIVHDHDHAEHDHQYEDADHAHQH